MGWTGERLTGEPMSLYLVLKNIDGKSDVGVNADGSLEANLSMAELFPDKATAERIAANNGGVVRRESDVFCDDAGESF
jgi:hypothetical protein